MSFKLIADTFSVARDTDHFIQLKNLKKPGTEDQAWIAIEIVGDNKYSRATAQSIVDTMEAIFFDKLEIGAYERFEEALKEVNIIIKNINEKRKNIADQINAIIAVFSGNELHLTQSNSAEAYMIRNNKFSMISEGLGSKSDDLFVNIASGEIQSDDKLIFCTARLLRLATHSQIVQMFSDGVAEAIEMIRDFSMNDESLSLGAIAIHEKLILKPAMNVESGENVYIAKAKELIKKASDFISAKIGNNEKLKSISPKKILAAIGVLVLILILSISLLAKYQRSKAIHDEYRQKLDALHTDINTANTKGYANDKESANAILDKVETDARQILDSNNFRAETLALLEKVQETRDSINNVTRFKDITPFADLAAKNPDVKAIGLLMLNENLFAYEYNKIYQIILSQVLDPKKTDSTEVITTGTVLEDQEVLVFLTQSGRVLEYADDQAKFASTEDAAWKNGVSVSAYGKNIYILSPKDNQIYKYSRLRGKYSAGTAYNSDVDLKDTLSLTVDGNVYVLKKGGSIIKLYKSQQVPFNIQNMAADLSDATKIFTSTELDNLYVLDPKNKKVIVIQIKDRGNDLKQPRYFGQIVLDNLDNIQDIFVEKNENKLDVLTDKAVYKLDI